MSAVVDDRDGIVPLEVGWDREIKPKGIRVLEDYLNRQASGASDTSRSLFTKAEYMHIYTTCYNMCTQRAPYNWSEELYHRHGSTFEDYLRSAVMPVLREKRDIELLQELIVRWENHRVMIKWMRLFFVYLDRYFVKYHSLPTLDEAGLNSFKKLVFEEFKRPVANSMLSLVNKEREGSTVNKELIRQCVFLFEAMGMGTLDVYQTDLETLLLSSTREFYAAKADRWMETDSTPAYLMKVERALEEEKQRVADYLHPETESKLLKEVERETLECRETELLEKEGSGCRALLAADRSEDLSRMFRLFSRLPEGLPPMADMFRVHVEALGAGFIEQRQARIDGGGDAAEEKKGDKEENEDPQFVRDLLGLHDKYATMVIEQFSGNALFQKALKDAFVETVNRSVGRYPTSELLSSFCDRLLKTGGEKVSEAEAEDTLERVVQLFSYLTDKDMFAELYRNQLAKRLLNQRSASDEMERLMIGKLKLRCGAQFTTKMEGMLNDLAIGADHQADFEKHCRELANNPCGKVEFSVQVLTTGHWPSYKTVDVVLPPALAQCIQAFRDFYEEKNGASRRLTWTHSLGQVTVKATFGKKSYDLQMTTLQVAALMTFNESTAELSFEQLQQALNLPEDVLKKVLHSLACGKYRVLRKTGVAEGAKESSSIKTTDSFVVNEQFTYVAMHSIN